MRTDRPIPPRHLTHDLALGRASAVRQGIAWYRRQKAKAPSRYSVVPRI